MSKKLYQAITYFRLSYMDKDTKDNKENESDSIANQRKMIDSFVEKNPDIEIKAEKIDDGWSGIVFDRPAFKEMMAEIEAGNINCVIVKDLSRFGRDYIETGRYLRRIFPAYGVRFIAINDSIDTLTDSGDDLVVSLKSIMNDAYCRDISVKTRSALSVKRADGDYVGACTVYGYRKSDESKNCLVIDEYPAGIVREIFRMKLEGLSASAISDSLNALGVLSPLEYKRDRGLPHPKGGFADKSDAKWPPTTVIRILKDETYAGTLLQGKKGTFNYKIKDIIDRPENEWVRFEDAHEAIISRNDFDLAQRVLRLDTRTAPGGTKVYLFSGILICGCCHGRMTRKTDRYKDKSYHYYYCPTGKKKGCSAQARIKESDLISCVLESIKSHVKNVISLEALLAGVDGELAGSRFARQLEAQIAENEQRLKQITAYKCSLYENMINGFVNKDDYRMLKSKYTEDGSALGQAISEMKRELEDVRDNKSERLQWIEHFKRFDGLTELNRKAIANLVQEVHIISKSELEVTFNYQIEFEKAITAISKEQEVA